MNKKQKGIALLEALIASVILAIGLIGAVGLQARASSALVEADIRAEATIASEKLIGIMSNDLGPGKQLTYNMAEGAAPPASLIDWHTETVKAIPGALISVKVEELPEKVNRVEILIKWARKKGEQENQHRTLSYTAES